MQIKPFYGTAVLVNKKISKRGQIDYHVKIRHDLNHGWLRQHNNERSGATIHADPRAVPCSEAGDSKNDSDKTKIQRATTSRVTRSIRRDQKPLHGHLAAATYVVGVLEYCTRVHSRASAALKMNHTLEHERTEANVLGSGCSQQKQTIARPPENTGHYCKCKSTAK